MVKKTFGELAHRKYKAPPLVEAVCEFRVPADVVWDIAMPGLFYEKVRDLYPDRKTRIVPGVEVTQEKDSLTQRLMAAEHLTFHAPEGTKFLQVGPRVVSAHCLPPYPSWQGFRPTVEKCYGSLLELAELKTLQRIGLRFVNRTELEKETVELTDYFAYGPLIGDALPQAIGPTQVTTLFPFQEDRDLCRVVFSTGVPTESQKQSFVLDIDYFLNKPGAVKAAEALDWVEVAHTTVEQLFEGCLTDRLREVFQPAQS